MCLHHYIFFFFNVNPRHIFSHVKFFCHNQSYLETQLRTSRPTCGLQPTLTSSIKWLFNMLHSVWAIGFINHLMEIFHSLRMILLGSFNLDSSNLLVLALKRCSSYLASRRRDVLHIWLGDEEMFFVFDWRQRRGGGWVFFFFLI